jgi:predicted metal-dependent enzyme (double-stranded beta helix superfamily)
VTGLALAPDIDRRREAGGRATVSELRRLARHAARSVDIDEAVSGGPDRTWQLLHADSCYEAWLISWPVGGAIELHDHGRSSGAVFVARGALTETRLVSVGPHPTLVRRRLPTGSTIGIVPSCVHDVVNTEESPAASIHVYSPRLESMTYYRLDGGRLRPTRRQRYHPDNPYHPAIEEMTNRP